MYFVVLVGLRVVQNYCRHKFNLVEKKLKFLFERMNAAVLFWVRNEGGPRERCGKGLGRFGPAV